MLDSMPKLPKRPRDVSQLGKMMVDIASGENGDADNPKKGIGRAGGLKGGPARAAKLTPEQRSEASRKAANKRWQS